MKDENVKGIVSIEGLHEPTSYDQIYFVHANSVGSIETVLAKMLKRVLEVKKFF